MGDVPEVEFALARAGRLAFQVWGEGADVVSVPPLAQNIELSWEHPTVRAMLERFGRIGRFLHYDKRGTGASGRISRPPDRDERVDDVRAVMDAAGIERAHLFGSSDGGATALLFAATYPDRVSSVVTFGSGAATVSPEWVDDLEMHALVMERQRELVQLWGTPDSPWVDGFAPSLAADQGFRDWHVRYQRACCDSETLLDLITMSIDTDVSEVLPEVRCPVLLLHRTGDRIVDVARSHEAAALLPDARVVEFPGEDHFGFAGDMDPWLDEFERWVRGRVDPRPPAARPSSVRVVTMGRFAVEVDGQEVPAGEWGSRHARTIVKRLAVARGWPVSRDELFELLWPGETDRRRVGARLSVQLSTVRRVLRGGVVADRESVRLDLDEVDLDLAAFDAATDDATAVAAWTGEFLPGDTDLPWTAATRAEVATRAAAAGARLAEAHLRRGLTGRAAEVARRLVEANPLDLRAHEVLVLALLETDQHDEAATAHAAWSAAGDELGVRVAPLDPA